MRGWTILGLLMACGGGLPDGRLEDEPCRATLPCRIDFVCGRDALCHPPGEYGAAEVGAACAATAECALDLACDATGTCAPEGDPGTGAPGDPCVDDSACRAELTCFEGACAGVEVPFWKGETCGGDAPEAFQARYTLPEGLDRPTWGSLPWPNDAWLDDRGLQQLEDFPIPDSPLPPLDGLADIWWSNLRSNAVGFAVTQPALFLLTGAPDATPNDGVVAIDVTLDDPAFGEDHPVSVRSGEANRLLCDAWTEVAPALGHPWKPGHTYLVGLRTTWTSEGRALSPAADLAPLLLADPPAEGRLISAWTRHGGVRQLLPARPEIAALGAWTLMTVNDPRPALAAAIQADTIAPGTPSWTAVTGGFDGVIPAPWHLLGREPFRRPEDGGGWVDAPGDLPPAPHDVPVALRIPTGPPPGGGWPLVALLRHEGTSLTDLDDDPLVAALVADRRAVLAIELPLNGLRATAYDDSAWAPWLPTAGDPVDLSFNSLHPRALQDVTRQAATELTSLVAAARRSPPPGAPLSLAAADVVGLGFGARVAAIAVGANGSFAHAVLFAPAADLVYVGFDRTAPMPFAGRFEAITAEPVLQPGHPVLSLWRNVVHGAEPAAYPPPIGVDVMAYWTPDDDLHGARAQAAFAGAWGFYDPDGAELKDVDAVSGGAARIGRLGAGTVGSLAADANVHAEIADFLDR